MRHAVALREFRWLVPASELAGTDGALSFKYLVEESERAFLLRSNSSDIEVFLQVIRDEEYRDAVRVMQPGKIRYVLSTPEPISG